MPLPTPTYIEQYDSRELSTDEAGNLVGQREWKVNYNDLSGATNADMDTIESHIYSTIGVNRFDSFPGAPLCLAQSARVYNDGAKHLWRARYGYSSRFDNSAGAGSANTATLGTDGFELPGSPTPAGFDKGTEAEARPFQVKCITRKYTAVLEHDAQTGARVENAAGDPFDPPATVEKSRLGYQITFFRYLANLRWAGANNRPDFRDHVNDAEFKIFGRPHPIGTLLVSDVQMSLIWDKGAGGLLVPVFQIDVELLEKPDLWQAHLLNAGRRENPGGGGIPLKPITDFSGQPVADPHPLTTGGYKLLPGGTLNYRDFWMYPKKNIRLLFT